MAYGMADRVKEQSTFAGGTGAINLPGVAVSGFQTFLAGWGASGTGEYLLKKGPAWEAGFGTLNAGGTALTRTTVYASSNAGAAVAFSAGVLDCFGDIPARLMEFLNHLEASVTVAATVDLGALKGAFVNVVAGSPDVLTVTSLGTAPNRTKVVRWGSAFTLTYNATSLILPGAVSRTTDTNGIGIYKSDASGNWREVAYYRGDGRVGIADGTAALPSLFLASDTNTGLYSVAADVLGITAGGTGRARFDTAALSPVTSDGYALGTTALMWADLFLASGGVINFNNGDVTITHSSNVLAFGGASSGYTFDAAIAPTTNGASGLGSSTNQFSNLFLASGSTVNYSNGDLVATHSTGLLTWTSTSIVQQIFKGTDATVAGGFQISNSNGSSLFFMYVFGPSHPSTGNVAIGDASSGKDVGFYTNNLARWTTGSAGGITVSTPTGGNKGDGTINATAVYDDNVLLTCAPGEWLSNGGSFDLVKWDAMVPDRVDDEQIQVVQIMEDVVQKQLTSADDGSLEFREAVTKVNVTQLVPVFDEHGNGIDAREVPVIEMVTVPEKRTPRIHTMAHRFKDMLDSGYDPSDASHFVNKFGKDSALPGMIRLDEWEHAKFSVGEVFNHMMLASELHALATVAMERRLSALENAKGVTKI